MTSQWWRTLVSGLVLALALAAGSPARCNSVSRAFQVLPLSAASVWATGRELPMESRRTVTARSKEQVSLALAGSARSPPCPAIA